MDTGSYGQIRSGPVHAGCKTRERVTINDPGTLILQPSIVMTLTTILLIILLLVLVGGVSTKGYGMGHGLNGGIGLVLVVLLVLYLMGKI